jgi:hypothetical protein
MIATPVTAAATTFIADSQTHNKADYSRQPGQCKAKALNWRKIQAVPGRLEIAQRFCYNI